MFEEILKEFLGTTKTFDDLFNEVFENKVNTDDVKDENNHSYFPKDCKCNDYCALKVTSQFWEDSFRSAEYTLIERDKKIAELERKLAKVTKEKEYFINKLAKVTKDKEYLLNKFEQVKNVFSK